MRAATSVLLAATLSCAVLGAQAPAAPAQHAPSRPAVDDDAMPEDAVGFDVVDGRAVPSASIDDPEAPTARRRSLAAPRAPRPSAPQVDDRELDEIIRAAAARHRLDPDLVACVIHQESGRTRTAVSPAGACGLMQLMPATARRFGVTDIFEPRQNVDAGCRYLRLLLDMFGGDVRLALAGYNAGEGRVVQYGYRVPPFAETQNYVAAILARYGRISAPVSTGAAQGATRSGTPISQIHEDDQ